MTYTTLNYNDEGGNRTNIGGALTLDGADTALGATFTIGTESNDVINVAVQLTDGDGNPIASRAGVVAYLASNASTLALATSADDIAIGTNGVYLEFVSNAAGHIVSTAAGQFDLNVTESSAATYYLVVLLPCGAVAVSGAIIFA